MLAGWGSLASAQAPASAEPSAAVTAEAAPSAATAPLAEPLAPLPVETLPVRQARELTARARERFDAGDYEAALLEFTRAHELLEGDPRAATLLNNIAVCQERLFRYDLALTYYERYLREADVSVEDRAELAAVIRGLRDLLGKLHLTSNVRAEVWIDGRMLGQAPGDLQVPSGARVVELRASGYQSSRRTLQVVARALTSAHFELELLPSYHGIDRAYFWSGVALTGVSLITGGALALGALGKHRDNQALRRAGLLRYDDPRQRSAQKLALAADITFGAAALFAVGTTVLAFLTDFGPGKPARDAAPSARLRLAPSIGNAGAGLALGGVFR